MPDIKPVNVPEPHKNKDCGLGTARARGCPISTSGLIADLVSACSPGPCLYSKGLSKSVGVTPLAWVSERCPVRLAWARA